MVACLALIPMRWALVRIHDYVIEFGEAVNVVADGVIVQPREFAQRC